MKPKLSSDLKSFNCLVTLSSTAGSNLVESIKHHGGQATQLPSITTSVIAASNPELTQASARIGNYDYFVFISPNAVHYGLDWLQPLLTKPYSESIQFAAVGKATAELLHAELGCQVLSPSVGNGAAALLELPQLKSLAQKRVLILRGQGGKEELAQQLRIRGAHVDYAELYTRHCPAAINAMQLTSLTATKYIIVGSQQGYLNLYDMLGSAAVDWLRQRTLLLPNPALAELVQDNLGLEANTVVLADMSHETIIQTLKQRIQTGG